MLMMRIGQMSNDTIQKTLFVAVSLCLACSVVVAAAAVLLKPMQITNKAYDRKKNIVEVAELLEEGGSVEEAFQQIETRIVDLDTGEYTDEFDPATFDMRQAARDPELGGPVPPDLDIANIKVKAEYAPVYLVKEGEQITTIILPVHGYGLWSTMYGFLALERDTKTVAGLKFYEHAETPGLGGEITNAQWLESWKGKVVYDDQWQPNIRVLKGKVDPDSPDIEHEVDGIGGATLTARGVMYMMQYWLSDQGYGKYLARLRNQPSA